MAGIYALVGNTVVCGQGARSNALYQSGDHGGVVFSRGRSGGYTDASIDTQLTKWSQDEMQNMLMPHSVRLLIALACIAFLQVQPRTYALQWYPKKL